MRRLPNIGFGELLLILVVALVIFGPKKLPEIGRTVGTAIREFRKASQDFKDSLDLGLDQPPTKAAGQGPAQLQPQPPPAGQAAGSVAAPAAVWPPNVAGDDRSAGGQESGQVGKAS